jgi:type IV pilus assembly protein PilZ
VTQVTQAAGARGMGIMVKDDDKPPPEVDPLPVRDSSPDRRSYDRYEVTWAVDCVASDTFLYASITNISEMGIFVRTTEPLPVGMRLKLAFEPPGHEPFKLDGQVTWINPVRANGDNPNPGMGIRFMGLELDDRERLVEVIRTIAYVRGPA